MLKVIYLSGMGTQNQSMAKETDILKQAFPGAKVTHFSSFPPKKYSGSIKSMMPYLRDKDAADEAVGELRSYLKKQGKPEDCILVGHSLGGTLAIALANSIRSQYKIHSLILLATAYPSNRHIEAYSNLLYSTCGNIYNFHSESDVVLSDYYTKVEKHHAIGECGMPNGDNQFIKNIDIETDIGRLFVKVHSVSQLVDLAIVGSSVLAIASPIARAAIGSSAIAIAAAAGYSAAGYGLKKYKSDINSHKAERYLKALKEYVEVCRDTQRKDLLGDFEL